MSDFEIKRSGRKTVALKVDRDGRIIVQAPLFMPEFMINQFVSSHCDWIEKQRARQKSALSVPKLTPGELRDLKERAREVITVRAAFYAPLAGVKYNKITIRAQKTRWGSCSSNGNLSFNCLLLLSPPEVLDSVVVHELCHLIERNHSERFYRNVLRVFPDYRKAHKWLRENGDSLTARIP